MMNAKQKTNLSLQRVLRRCTACCLALLGLWLFALSLPRGPSTGILQRLGEHPGLLTAALAAQLGTQPEPTEANVEETNWERLLLTESSLLSGWQHKEGPPPAVIDAEAEEEDPTALAAAPQAAVVEKFFQGSDTESYAKANGLYILNKTKKQLDVSAIAATPPGVALGPNSAPQILIMHTHGSEAYTQDGTDVYQESGVTRTTDPSYNTIRVGEEIGRIFTELGLSVLHDQTLYDYPNYNGAYERSRVGIERYLADYPSIQIVLDVHRDALVGQDGTIYKAVTEVDGQKTAQIMLVIGSDDGGAVHPNWQQNLSLALRMQHRMNTLWPGLARPLALRSSRFNQQLRPGSALVEVGSHGNTLQEALAGARLFARSAGQVFLELQQ